jgi:hypothetical protein
MPVRIIWFTSIVLITLLLGNLARLSFLGAQPNILLIVLVVLGVVVRRPLSFVVIAILATTVSANVFLLYWEVAMLFLLTVSVFLAKDRLPWRPGIVFLISISAVTVAVYLLTDPVFLVRYPIVIFKEVIYNGIIGALLYYVFSRFLGSRLHVDRMVS